VGIRPLRRQSKYKTACVLLCVCDEKMQAKYAPYKPFIGWVGAGRKAFLAMLARAAKGCYSFCFARVKFRSFGNSMVGRMPCIGHVSRARLELRGKSRSCYGRLSFFAIEGKWYCTITMAQYFKGPDLSRRVPSEGVIQSF